VLINRLWKYSHLEITRVIAKSLEEVPEEQKLLFAELFEVEAQLLHGAEAGTVAARVHPATAALRYCLLTKCTRRHDAAPAASSYSRDGAHAKSALSTCRFFNEAIALSDFDS
jgi:hypothetical protein